MKKALKRLKKSAGKTARRPKPRTAKIITRAEARLRAARHVLNRMFKGATVRNGVEAGGNIYNVRREDTWVTRAAYKAVGAPKTKFLSVSVSV